MVNALSINGKQADGKVYELDLSQEIDLSAGVGESDIDTIIETSPLAKDDRVIDAAIRKVHGDVELALQITTSRFLVEHPDSVAALIVVADARTGDLFRKIDNDLTAEASTELLLALIREQDPPPRLQNMIARIKGMLADRLRDVAASLGTPMESHLAIA